MVDQVTAVFLEPVPLALNCCVPLVSSVADTGEIDTVTGALERAGVWAEAPIPNRPRRPANAIAGKYDLTFRCMGDVI